MIIGEVTTKVIKPENLNDVESLLTVVEDYLDDHIYDNEPYEFGVSEGISSRLAEKLKKRVEQEDD